MKRKIALLLTMALLAVSVTACQSQKAASTPSPDPVETPESSETPTNPSALNLLDIFESNPVDFNCINTGTFSAEASDAPSDEELTRMLDFAMAMGSAHQLTPAHFIVIRDHEEQSKILSVMGENLATPGTVMVLALADTLRDEENHEADYNGWYSQMYYGIFDAGSAFGYLNLAANALGYRSHFYAAINVPVGGVVDITNGGRFDLIEGQNWETERYTTSKDGKVSFVHTVGTYMLPNATQEVSAEGNLTLLCVSLIGKPDAALDAVSAATSSNKPANYNFWDPQDGVSYGNSVAGSGIPATNSTNLWDKLPDGSYTGKGESASSQYTVEAVISGGSLESVSVVEGRENMLIASDDLDAFLNAIVTSQSLTVDTVSGATQDCQGIISALQSAFTS